MSKEAVVGAIWLGSWVFTCFHTVVYVYGSLTLLGLFGLLLIIPVAPFWVIIVAAKAMSDVVLWTRGG